MKELLGSSPGPYFARISLYSFIPGVLASDAFVGSIAYASEIMPAVAASPPALVAAPNIVGEDETLLR